MHLHILFSRLFFIIGYYKIFEYSSLCYTVDHFLTYFMYNSDICKFEIPNLSLPADPQLSLLFVFYVCGSISVLKISSFVSVF